MEQVDKKKSWKLTKRDVTVLKEIGEYGFSSSRWIKEHFSKIKSNCNHYRRLSILRKMGMIENMIGDDGNKLAYRLSKKGIVFLRSQGFERGESSEFRAAYRTTYNHDDYLVGIGKVLRSFFGVIEYWPERLVRQKLTLKYGHKERKRDGYKVPDALFTVQTKQRRLRVALELEIAPKSKMYYRKILNRLITSTDFDLVLVVVPDVNALKRLTTALTWVRANDVHVKYAGRDNGFYFAILADVLTDKGNAKFIGEGTVFMLAQLAS